MTWEIFRFEVRYHLRGVLFWLLTFLFGLMTFGAITSDSVSIGGAIGNVHRNAPYVILQILGVMSFFSIFVATAFVANAALRDFDLGTAELFFSRPIKKAQYLLGRFLGSLTVAVLVFVGPCLGILLGSLMPWLEPERLGPFSLTPYLYALSVFVLPNVLFAGAVFFGLASVTRSMLATYLGVVVFMVFYFISQILMGDLPSRGLASFLDPFGLAAFGLETRYWSAAERNTELPSVLSALGANRLLWVVVGVAAFALAAASFRTDREGLARFGRRKKALAEPQGSGTGVAAAPLTVARDFSRRGHWASFLRLATLETSTVVKSVPFLVILALGTFNFLLGASFTDQLYGTKVYPVTHLMLDQLDGNYLFLLIIITTFFAGEIVWRERAIKFNEVFDVLPLPNWVPLVAKLTALAAVVVSFVAVGALASMAFQAVVGYFHFELPLYAKGLLIAVAPFLLFAVLAIALQVFTNHKLIGMLAMILFMLSSIVLRSLDFEHRLYRYASTGESSYSDMNGYGHFVTPVTWFTTYWTFFALFLLALASLFWVRGTGLSWRDRLAIARQRFRGPVRALTAVSLLGFLAVGGWIFYNTNVLNAYMPGDRVAEQQAEYEKKYRQHKDLLQPRVVKVSSDVDIFPAERRMRARATYRLENRGAEPIPALHLTTNPRVDLRKLEFRAHREEMVDRDLGYAIYRFEAPLQPGEGLDLTFEVEVRNPGFVNDSSDTSLVENGTFFNNRQYFPTLGYDEGRQLVDRNERRKHDLPPVLRMPKIDDLAARGNTYIASDSDWIEFETTISTSPDQIALAPGYLEKEWTENGRRFFRYIMDAPILHFYSYLSARYEVRRDHWNDVAIEIYYHAPHAENVERMVEAVKKSLDYFTTHLSPYQHRQVRILEFPRYATFAQSFPNTIPFSESIGFIADLSNPDDIDYVFYVTAHEVAHQWWAHQVIGGNVQGSTMLSETLAQYSALMVMEKEYGREKMRKFLKYELDRYLAGRGGELIEELPLALVENQPYVHYAKGSLVMYALRDYLGEDVVNAALARFLKEKGFQQPPFTVSRELITLFREAAGPERQGLIDDLFEKITFFDNQAKVAKAEQLPDGKYKVTLEVAAKKLYADGLGVETEAALDDWIDVGVFAKEKSAEGKSEDRILFLEKRRITGASATFEITVDAKPSEAGIDPLNKLVDRNADDNRKVVEVG